MASAVTIENTTPPDASAPSAEASAAAQQPAQAAAQAEPAKIDEEKMQDVIILNTSANSNIAAEAEAKEKAKKKRLLDEILDDPLAKHYETLSKRIDEERCVKLGEGHYKIALNGCSDYIDFKSDGKTESITLKGASLFKGMSPEAADTAMKMAADRGWTSVALKGPAAKKDMLWYAAKMNGLEVTGYEPKPDSAIVKKLEKDLAEQKKLQDEALKNAAPKAEEQQQAAPASKFADGEKPKAEGNEATAPAVAAPADNAPKAEPPKADIPKQGSYKAGTPREDSPKNFQQWIEQAAREAPSKVERDGLNKLGEAVASGKIKMDGLESDLVRAKHGVEGYNSAMKLAQGIADRSNSGIVFPKAAENEGPKAIPSSLDAANRRYPPRGP